MDSNETCIFRYSASFAVSKSNETCLNQIPDVDFLLKSTRTNKISREEVLSLNLAWLVN